MNSEGKCWIEMRNIEQLGKISDREGKYSIETEKYWTETGNMRQRREISVGEVK